MQAYPLPTRTAEVLLVDDDEIDALLTQECLRKSNMPINLHHVPDGRQCMHFLRKQSCYRQVPTPDLILLDLHMPIMNGMDVLTELQQDTALNQLPVVVISHSCDGREIDTMYHLGCKLFLQKSMDFFAMNLALQDLMKQFFPMFFLSNTESRA